MQGDWGGVGGSCMRSKKCFITSVVTQKFVCKLEKRKEFQKHGTLCGNFFIRPLLNNQMIIIFVKYFLIFMCKSIFIVEASDLICQFMQMQSLRRELSVGLRPLHETFVALIRLFGSKGHATRGLEILAAMEKLNYDIRKAWLVLIGITLFGLYFCPYCSIVSLRLTSHCVCE